MIGAVAARTPTIQKRPGLGPLAGTWPSADTRQTFRRSEARHHHHHHHRFGNSIPPNNPPAKRKHEWRTHQWRISACRSYVRRGGDPHSSTHRSNLHCFFPLVYVCGGRGCARSRGGYRDVVDHAEITFETWPFAWGTCKRYFSGMAGAWKIYTCLIGRICFSYLRWCMKYRFVHSCTVLITLYISKYLQLYFPTWFTGHNLECRQLALSDIRAKTCRQANFLCTCNSFVSCLACITAVFI